MAIVGAIAVPHPPLIVPAVGRGDQARIQDTIDAYEQADIMSGMSITDALIERLSVIKNLNEARGSSAI